MELVIGTRIYYGGDTANHSGTGTITDKIPAGEYNPPSVNIVMDDGRKINMLSEAMFSSVYKGNGLTNFVTENEYQIFKDECIRRVMSYCHK